MYDSLYYFLQDIATNIIF